MKDKILYLLAGLFLMGLIWVVISKLCNQNKVVVVNSQQVLEEYNGFKEAKDAYEIKLKKLSENFDAQRRIYETKGKEFEILEKNLSEDEKQKTQANLLKMKEELLRSGSALENQSSIEEGKLLQAVLNKINDFMERYGKSKGYNVILGANGQGNIIYTNEKIDITSKVIEALNNEYVQGVKY